MSEISDLDVRLALIAAVRDLADLEGDLRKDVLTCCDGRERFCESHGCSTIERIADRLQAIRREAMVRADD